MANLAPLPALFMTHEDFAKTINRSPRSIYNIITSKKFTENERKKRLPPFKKVMGRYIVAVRDVERWLHELPTANKSVKRNGRPRNTKNQTKGGG